jgi:hypothetical protein
MMASSLIVLLCLVTEHGFGPDVRIDRLNLPEHSCRKCAITVGPGAPSSQPIYVAFEDDSTLGIAIVRADIMFQKSTDAGRTWLPTDLLIRRGAPCAYYPDITTDLDGNVYIVFKDVINDTAGEYYTQVSCVRSSDGGATWSPPARVDDRPKGSLGGPNRIAADSAGNLFCAWRDKRTGSFHIWSSVSTDRGATWSQNVQVDDDTTDHDCAHADVFVQPGTNHYLVTAEVPRLFENRPHIRNCAFLYRSTDRGLTFQPGVQLDTFNRLAVHPHVVADRDHIVCDYSGRGRTVRDTTITEARTFYTQADTWGTPSPVTNLDSLHELYLSGALALSGDGRVHTALMVRDTAAEWQVYYTSSLDHGVSWSDIGLVSDHTTSNRCWYPDIGADIAGHAYVVWEGFDGDRGTIWFSTNSPAGIAEEPTQPCSTRPIATVVRNFLLLPEASSHKPQAASLLDISGRRVQELVPGANDVRALAPGVYFVREPQTSGLKPQAVRKVVVTR